MLVLVRILSLFPICVLYAIADALLYPIAYYVVRYRRKIVRKNLTLSFPELSRKEITQLERKFYHHFADTIAEIIYGYRIADDEMQRRFIFENVELIERLAKEKKCVFLMLGHLGNWEWIADIAKRFEDPAVLHYNVYRRQKNAAADKTMLMLRSKRGGGGCIEKNSLLRWLVAHRNDAAPVTIGLISDQKPTPRNAHFWTTFLNQDTAFLNGGEILAKKFDYAVVYVHIHQTRRGYYTARFDLISEDTKNTPEFAITGAFAQMLQNNILEQPELWLWSHNRWKFQKKQANL